MAVDLEIWSLGNNGSFSLNHRSFQSLWNNPPIEIRIPISWIINFFFMWLRIYYKRKSYSDQEIGHYNVALVLGPQRLYIVCFWSSLDLMSTGKDILSNCPQWQKHFSFYLFLTFYLFRTSDHYSLF